MNHLEREALEAAAKAEHAPSCKHEWAHADSVNGAHGFGSTWCIKCHVVPREELARAEMNKRALTARAAAIGADWKGDGK